MTKSVQMFWVLLFSSVLLIGCSDVARGPEAEQRKILPIVYVRSAAVIEKYQPLRRLDSAVAVRTAELEQLGKNKAVNGAIDPKTSEYIVAELAQLQNQYQKQLDSLNSLISEWGKARGYGLILGTSDTPTILYGDSTLDVTDSLAGYLSTKK